MSGMKGAICVQCWGLTSALNGLFDERNIGGGFPFVAVVVVVELRGAFIHRLNDKPNYQFQTHIAGAEFVAILQRSERTQDEQRHLE
jgi:hypothetical protein